MSVLVIFLDYLSYHAHRGRESFETHVWMLKTLLWQSKRSKEDVDAFLLYGIAVSFGKMKARMANKHFSVPYLRCLLKQTTFPFVAITSVMPNAGKEHSDQPFINAIPSLAQHTDTQIPNLNLAAKQVQPIEIYNKDTYMEFHLLLCELLSKFGISLIELGSVQKAKGGLGEILKALKKVRVFGLLLRTMVTGSAIDKHLQCIASLLVVDSRKMWTPEPGGSEEADFTEFHRLKPWSIRKGKTLFPWESYRDWLRLMIRNIDTPQVLVAYATGWESQPPNPLSITILSPPLPGDEMLPWIKLLETERYFPTRPGEPSGKDFISFLTKSYVADTPESSKISIRDVTKLAQAHRDVPADLTKIKTLTQQVKKCTSVGRKNDIDRIVERLEGLHRFEPKDQPAQILAIVDMLETLTKRAAFYVSLKKGPLCCGEGFSGKHHCEAYVASLLTLLFRFGQHFDDFEGRLNLLSPEDINQIKALLIELQVSHIFMHRFESLSILTTGLPACHRSV